MTLFEHAISGHTVAVIRVGTHGCIRVDRLYPESGDFLPTKGRVKNNFTRLAPQILALALTFKPAFACAFAFLLTLPRNLPAIPNERAGPLLQNRQTFYDGVCPDTRHSTAFESRRG